MTVNNILQGDCLELLKSFPDESIDCCITSPPYYGLRDYGVEGQMGLEQTPQEYVDKMVLVFSEVKRVLKKEGTLWLNIGDSYNGYPANVTRGGKLSGNNQHARHIKESGYGLTDKSLKPKDLIGIPWMLAFGLRSDGWYLRQDIIWSKPNPMPESVTDRCTKSHEYIFILSKSQKYYYDQDAIKQPAIDNPLRERFTSNSNHINSAYKSKHNTKGYKHRGTGDQNLIGHSGNYSKDGTMIGDGNANKRSVWTVATKPFKEAHFATFPEDLIVDCIKAGCPEGGIVLDPFGGAATTAIVAKKLNRNYILCELNPEYVKIGEKRIKQLGELF